MRNVKQIVLFALAALLVSCASLGVPPADTFNKRLAETLAVVTQVEQSTVQLVQSGVVKPDDGQNIHDQATRIVAGLNIAYNMHANDPAGADARLVAARTTLIALQGYLQVKGAKP